MQKSNTLIIGTGFGGIGMGIELLRAGRRDFLILEAADGIGGTWLANSYPGAACDIESHLYSFSFEPNPTWSRTFATQPEILKYLEHVVDKYGLRPYIRFNRRVDRAVYDERAQHWTVRAGGEEFVAQTVVSATGGLSKPQLPNLKGIANFKGTMFHSARWDHAQPLAGKRVAVIGTGASAVQIIPEIAKEVAHLKVFQRTAPWILPKPDKPYTDEQRTRWAKYPVTQRLDRWRQYLMHEVLAVGFTKEPRLLKLASKLATSYLQRKVADPVLRQKLTPNYTMGCKRILPSNHYYPALSRPNVELVTDGILEIREHSIVTRDGAEHAVDAIVLATGFYAAESVAPFEVRGVGGRELSEEWRAGAEAYLGCTVAGFPNLFMIVGPNTGLGHSSMVYMIESQIAYVASAITTIAARGLGAVDVKSEVQADYNAAMHARFAPTVWESGCASWYRTANGKNTTLWPGFTFEFRWKTRKFDAENYRVVPAAR